MKNNLKKIQTATIYSGYILLGLNAGATGPNMNDLALNNSVNIETISYLLVFRAIGGFLGAFIGARLYDKIKPKNILMTLYLLAAIIFALIPNSNNIISSIIIFFLLGITISMIDAGSNISITRIHSGKSSSVLSGLHFVFGIGAFLFPMVVSWFKVNKGSGLYSYYIISATAIIVLILISRLQSLPQEEHKKSLDVVKLKVPQVLVMMLFLFFYVGTEVTFGVWINNFSILTGAADEVQAALLTSIFYGAFTATRLLSIPILKKIKDSYILIVSLIITILSLSSLLYINISFLTLTIITLFAGVGTASIIPVFISMIKNSFGYNGKIAGFLQSGMWLGVLFFPWFSGKILGSNNYLNFPKSLSTTAIIAVAALIYILISIKKGKVNGEKP